MEDVGTICQVIESLGVKITRNKADDEIIFDASTLTATEAPYELVRKMRASFPRNGATFGAQRGG